MKSKNAIYVCGSGGSGKTTFASHNFPNHVPINVDNHYENFLVESGLGLKIDTFNQIQKTKALEYFEESKIITNKLFFDSVNEGKDLVIDTVGRDLDFILKQRKYLYNQGYNTYMVMLYASLETCHYRVSKRNRTYDYSLTKDSWGLSYKNLVDFATEFGDNFLLINTENMDYEVNKLNNFKNTLKILKNYI
jgi:predicted kinase